MQMNEVLNKIICIRLKYLKPFDCMQIKLSVSEIFENSVQTNN